MVGEDRLLWTLPVGGLSSWSGGGSGRKSALEAFPVLYGEEMITEQPWPSTLREMMLAYRFLPGVGMKLGTRAHIDGPRGVISGLSLRLGNTRDPRCCGPSRWPSPSGHPNSSRRFLQRPLPSPLTPCPTLTPVHPLHPTQVPCAPTLLKTPQ